MENLNDEILEDHETVTSIGWKPLHVIYATFTMLQNIDLSKTAK